MDKISSLKSIHHSYTEISEYLKTTAKKHSNYRHYSNYIDNILNSRSLYLSDGSKWEDRIDSNNFTKLVDNKANYGLCFTYSMSESVAIWKLYAPKGAMLNLTKSMMDKIIENTDEVKLGQFIDGDFVTIHTCRVNKEDVFCIDMLYYDTIPSERKEYKQNDGEKNYRVRHSDEPLAYIEKTLIQRMEHVKKCMPWSYEKECRLVIRLDKSIVEKANMNKQNKEEPLTMCVPIDCIDKERLKERIVDSPCSETNRYKRSTLKDKVVFR